MKSLTLADLNHDYGRIVVQYESIDARKYVWQNLIDTWYCHIDKSILNALTTEYFGETI